MVMAIPSDDDLEAGGLPPLDPSPVDLTDVPGQPSSASTEEQPKRRRRGPMPRDAQGNVIRKPREPSKERERKAKVEEFKKSLHEEINPLVLDLATMLSGLPQPMCYTVKDGVAVPTEIGKNLQFSDFQINIYAQTGARIVETPMGAMLANRLGTAVPYAFLGMAIIVTLLWFGQIVVIRRNLAQQLQAQMQNVQGQGAPSSNGANPMQDMMQGLVDQMTKAEQSGTQPTE